MERALKVLQFIHLTKAAPDHGKRALLLPYARKALPLNATVPATT